MQKTKMSSKGQVIIPKNLRDIYKWEIGQELAIIDTGDGILLKPAQLFKETKLEQVVGILRYSGKPITLEEMEGAIINELWRKMTSVDTNVIVRFLKADDRTQFAKAKSLFAREIIYITITVLLETEWVLRYACKFNPLEIIEAFESLFGLANVVVEDQLLVQNAHQWHKSEPDFADALHLSKSQVINKFATFDKSLIKAGKKVTGFQFEEPK